MQWRVIAHGDEVWHVDVAAERHAHMHSWQLVLTFRSASQREPGRSYWAPYPMEGTSERLT